MTFGKNTLISLDFVVFLFKSQLGRCQPPEKKCLKINEVCDDSDDCGDDLDLKKRFKFEFVSSKKFEFELVCACWLIFEIEGKG